MVTSCVMNKYLFTIALIKIVNNNNRLFAGYKRRRVGPTSVSAQLANYIALCDEFDESNVLTCSSANRSHSSKLFPLAMQVLSVTASIAQVERVFSHGGLTMRPHRSRLSDKMLSNLIFLKCNTIGEKEQLTQACSVVTVRPILRCNITLMLAASLQKPTHTSLIAKDFHSLS